jgi:hypothetical protein
MLAWEPPRPAVESGVDNGTMRLLRTPYRCFMTGHGFLGGLQTKTCTETIGLRSDLRSVSSVIDRRFLGEPGSRQASEWWRWSLSTPSVAGHWRAGLPEQWEWCGGNAGVGGLDWPKPAHSFGDNAMYKWNTQSACLQDMQSRTGRGVL